jgi:hypothetical protein
MGAFDVSEAVHGRSLLRFPDAVVLESVGGLLGKVCAGAAGSAEGCAECDASNPPR